MSPQRTAPNRGAWIVAVLALAGYASAVALILVLRAESMTAPWWGPAIHLVVYAIVAVATVRSFSMFRLLTATVVLCATHGLLLAGTIAVVAVVVPNVRLPLSSAALGMLMLVCVPLVFTPLRSLVRGPRGSSPRSKRAAASSPAPSRGRAASPMPPVPQPAFRPVAAPGSWPAPPPRAGQPESGQPAGRPTVKPYAFAALVADPPPSPPTPPASPIKAGPIASSAPPPASSPLPETTSVSAPPRSRPSVRAAESGEPMIRIPFARIADQLAAEAFTLPREQVGAQLQEADVLLVPERLVHPQLVEGIVQVGWAQVAEQFPRQALALSNEEIVQRLPNGTLVLPLDEVVGQVSPDVFVLAAAAKEEGLEDFPLPFQPPALASAEPDAAALEEPAPEEPALEEPSPEPSAPVAERQTDWTPETAAADPGAKSFSELESGAEEQTDWAPEPVAADPGDEPAPEPEPVAEQQMDWTPEPEPAQEEAVQEWAPEPSPLAERQTDWTPEPEPEPVREEAVQEWAPEPEPAVERQMSWTTERVQEEAPRDWTPEPARAADAVTDEGQEAPHNGSRADDARRMAVLLGPLLSPVTVENCERGGASFLTLAPTSIAGTTVADVAARVLPFLTDTRLPEPAVQATVRGTAMTVVITPLAGAPDMAFAAATLPGASLALLERLCLKEAAVPVAANRPVVRVPAPSLGAELREAPPEPSVVAVAASLSTFGRVTASVLHDPDDPFVVYLFLPSGLEVRALGGFARNLHRALADSPAGAPASVLLRVGTRRLVIRPVEGVRRAVLVAGGGPVERPGMARLELERAAARLGKL